MSVVSWRQSKVFFFFRDVLKNGCWQELSIWWSFYLRICFQVYLFCFNICRSFFHGLNRFCTCDVKKHGCWDQFDLWYNISPDCCYGIYFICALFFDEISSISFSVSCCVRKLRGVETSRKYDTTFAYDSMQIKVFVFYVIICPLFLGDNPKSFSFFVMY